MNLVALTTIKNGCLHKALAKLGWSQSDLARRSGLSPTIISQLALMKRPLPTDRLLKVQAAFGDAGHFVSIEDLWPDGFTGFGRRLEVKQYKEVDNSHLIQFQENCQLAIEDSKELEDMEFTLGELSDQLDARDRELLRLVTEGHSREEISKSLRMSKQHVSLEIGRLSWKLEHLLDRDSDLHAADTRAFIKRLREDRLSLDS